MPLSSDRSITGNDTMGTVDTIIGVIGIHIKDEFAGWRAKYPQD